MGEESLDPFAVSNIPEPEPGPLSAPERRRETVADKRYLCVTVVDHNAVINGTGEESYVNIRIPVSLAASALKLVPEGKLGRIDPDLIVEMVEEGATGTLVSITEEKKTISIRIE